MPFDPEKAVNTTRPSSSLGERVTDVAEGNGSARNRRRKVQDKRGITRRRRAGPEKVGDRSGDRSRSGAGTKKF